MAKKNKFKLGFGEHEFCEFSENYNEEDFSDAIVKYSFNSGVNKNVSRYISLMFDGLKPVARRTLLVLYEKRGAGNRMRKVNAISGDVMGKYHPHGNTSIDDTLGKMGQWWYNQKMFIDGTGNYGNLTGAGPAASRYIECRLSAFAYKCYFEDYKYASLERVPTYTGEDTEPTYLPAKYPMGIINPSFSSIGYGMSSNIPSYNFTEVLEATIKLIENPEARINLIPDLPTGSNIILTEKLKEVNKTGVGTLTNTAKFTIDYDENSIHITALPYGVGTRSVKEKLVKLKLNKKLDDIINIDSATSSLTGVNETIYLKKTANPDKFMDMLMNTNVGLKETKPVCLRFIDDYHDYVYTPRTYLLAWLDKRREIVRSMYNNKYVMLKEEEHMNDVLIYISDESRVKETLSIIRKSKRDEIVPNLMARYGKEAGMTSMQAARVSKMRFYELSQDEHQRFLERRNELTKEIGDTFKVINSDNAVNDIIISELKEGIKLFGEERRSKIIRELSTEEKVPNTEHLVAVSADGYIKKLDAKKYYSIGSIGKQPNRFPQILKINNRNSIMFFDSTGKVSVVNTYSINDMEYEEDGVPVERFFPVSGKVVRMIETPKKGLAKELYAVLITKNGFAKRLNIKQFLKVITNKTAINLSEGDELVDVELVYENTKSNIVIFTNKGNGIRLNPNDIKEFGAQAKGSRIVPFNPLNDEYVSGVNIIKPKKKYMFYLTSSGRAKLTDMSLFPKMNKKDEVMNLINLEKNENLVGVAGVDKEDSVMVYRKNGEPVELLMKDIDISTRIAKATKYVKTPKGDSVVSYLVIEK